MSLSSAFHHAGRALLALVSLCSAFCALSLNAATMPSNLSVNSFHTRAQAGEPLNVVFLGGSLTWGANASDPQKTSYRGLMMQWLEEEYPNTPIRFYDAAIGGTGSDLGQFRLERDVLAHNPDLVFLDFSVNDGAEGDDPERFASYENIVRTLLQHDIPVIQVLMMFKWHAKEPGAPLPPRHLGHIALGEAYNIPVANTIPHVRQAVADGVAIETLWPFDGAHPDDPGYTLFFEAIRDRYLAAASDSEMTARIPEEALYGDRYPERTRLILSETQLPEGWEVNKTYRTSLWFDGLSSRWMGDVATASKSNQSAPLEIEFTGSLVGFFGEHDVLTPDVRIWIDGEPIQPPKAKEGEYIWELGTERFSPGTTKGSNLFLWKLIANDLEDGPHTLKIEPIWDDAADKSQLRIESICYAGKTK